MHVVLILVIVCLPFCSLHSNLCNIYDPAHSTDTFRCRCFDKIYLNFASFSYHEQIKSNNFPDCCYFSVVMCDVVVLSYSVCCWTRIPWNLGFYSHCHHAVYVCTCPSNRMHWLEYYSVLLSWLCRIIQEHWTSKHRPKMNLILTITLCAIQEIVSNQLNIFSPPMMTGRNIVLHISSLSNLKKWSISHRLWLSREIMACAVSCTVFLSRDYDQSVNLTVPLR